MKVLVAGCGDVGSAVLTTLTQLGMIFAQSSEDGTF